MPADAGTRERFARRPWWRVAVALVDLGVDVVIHDPQAQLPLVQVWDGLEKGVISVLHVSAPDWSLHVHPEGEMGISVGSTVLYRVSAHDYRPALVMSVDAQADGLHLDLNVSTLGELDADLGLFTPDELVHRVALRRNVVTGSEVGRWKPKID